YKNVQIKSEDSCELKVMIGSRRQLVGSRQQIIVTIRGLLKIYGIKLSRTFQSCYSKHQWDAK
ncbi:hypothetical protein, partial [Rickettsiales endosymbiont of Peranema trichophorum]